LVNQTARPGDGKAITTQLQMVLNRFVGAQPNAHTETGKAPQTVRLVHVGDIPADVAVKEAVMRRQLLLTQTPGSPAGVAVTQIAGRLAETVIVPDDPR